MCRRKPNPCDPCGNTILRENPLEIQIRNLRRERFSIDYQFYNRLILDFYLKYHVR